MEFHCFKDFVQKTIKIILADLDNLQKIANEVNDNFSSSTVTLETTKSPDCNEVEEPDKISRCTIPIVMVCLSVIDMIGQWVKTRPDDDFGSSAQAFFKVLSGKDDLNKQAAQEKFKKYFRNEIMHSFFADKEFGVSYPIFAGNSLFTGENGSTLDAKYLLDVVRCGLNKLEEEIKNEKSDIAQKAFQGFKAWSKSVKA